MPCAPIPAAPTWAEATCTDGCTSFAASCPGSFSSCGSSVRLCARKADGRDKESDRAIDEEGRS